MPDGDGLTVALVTHLQLNSHTLNPAAVTGGGWAGATAIRVDPLEASGKHARLALPEGADGSG